MEEINNSDEDKWNKRVQKLLVASRHLSSSCRVEPQIRILW
jgi:hypothetical protein